MANLYNLAAYQIAWFAVVLSAAAGKPWIGATLALILIAVHVMGSSNRRGELELICAASMIGVLVDSMLAWGGHLAFSSGVWAQGWSPYWMVALWAAFATTLNHSLAWLTRRPLLAALLGAIAGPLAYAAGAKLGALQIPQPRDSLLVIAAAWAAAMWLLAALSRRNTSSSTASLAFPSPPA